MLGQLYVFINTLDVGTEYRESSAFEYSINDLAFSVSIASEPSIIKLANWFVMKFFFVLSISQITLYLLSTNNI